MLRFFLVLSFFILTQNSHAQDPVYDYLVWADEFNDTGAIDGSKWHHQTQLPNGDSWYNGEIQHYTDREENSFMSDGSLFVKAIKESYTNQGVTKQYTSARLNSKFAFTYGRVEIKAILPYGVGPWPAMWSLGKNIIEPGGYWSNTNGTVNWPACGEIDIMEHWGNNQDYVSSALHTPSSYGNTMNVGGRNIPGVSNEYHIYEMIWSPEKIVFKVDDIIHYVYEPAVQNADTWPFDAEQYLLLNFAILPSIDTAFTEDAMDIDYVRVFQETVLDADASLLKDQIAVFPNPLNELLHIKIPITFLGSELHLYSILGQEVMIETLSSSDSRLDVSLLSTGTYILEIETPLGVFKEMLIK
jgi:beta-glucanase (GH16 family)